VAVDKFWVKRCLGEKEGRKEGQNNEEKNRMLVIRERKKQLSGKK
jgi:hypothetical protein